MAYFRRVLSDEQRYIEVVGNQELASPHRPEADFSESVSIIPLKTVSVLFHL